MFSRKDYHNKRCTHREYYAQFVTRRTLLAVQSAIGLGRLQRSTDEHMNDIPLASWDAIPHFCAKLEPYGDYLTAASWVCIAKEAARQLVECGGIALVAEEATRVPALTNAAATTIELIALTEQKLTTLRKMHSAILTERALYQPFTS